MSSKSCHKLLLTFSLLVTVIHTLHQPVHSQSPSPVAAPLVTSSGSELSNVTPTPPQRPYLPPDYPILTPESLAEFKVMNFPSVGGRLALGATVGDFERILLLDLNHRKLSSLIDGPGNNTQPTWSLDGTKLAFTSDRDGNKEIYVSDWSGMNQTRVTFNPSTDESPTWSPDATKLAFSSEDGSGNYQIYTINLDGSDRTALSKTNGKNAIPNWSPDGKSITYSTNRFWPGWDVCVLNLAQNVESCPLQGRDNFCRSVWSHDGESLSYSFGSSDEINIGTLNYAKQVRTQITTLPGREYDAVWSPNSQFIAFVAEESPGRNVFNLFMAEPGKDKLSEVVKSANSIRYLSWTSATTDSLVSRFAPPTASASPTPEPSIDTIDLLPDEYVPGYLQNQRRKESK